MNFFRNIVRGTTGWICKGCMINFGRKEKCYYCQYCGIGGEYCYGCANSRNMRCGNGHPLDRMTN